MEKWASVCKHHVRAVGTGSTLLTSCNVTDRESVLVSLFGLREKYTASALLSFYCFVSFSLSPLQRMYSILDFKILLCCKCCMFPSGLFQNTLSVPSLWAGGCVKNHLPMKMGQTERSETSAHKIQMPGYYPEESIQYIYSIFMANFNVLLTVHLLLLLPIALRPFQFGLGFLYNWCPFLSFQCFRSLPFHTEFPYVVFHIIYPPESRSTSTSSSF